jgi:hypothetical protein
VRVEHHGNKHDGVTEQDCHHRLPPVHAGFYKTTGESVGGDYYAHAYPQCCNVPGGPCAFFDGGGREVFIPKRAGGNVFSQLFKVALS